MRALAPLTSAAEGSVGCSLVWCWCLLVVVPLPVTFRPIVFCEQLRVCWFCTSVPTLNARCGRIGMVSTGPSFTAVRL